MSPATSEGVLILKGKEVQMKCVTNTRVTEKDMDVLTRQPRKRRAGIQH